MKCPREEAIIPFRLETNTFCIPARAFDPLPDVSDRLHTERANSQLHEENYFLQCQLMSK